MADLPTSRPSPDDKTRVEAMVAACIEALERGEADPATRLCGDDIALLTRVQRRLAQLASRGLIPDSDALPATIGPYRILKELGSGGMGSVYLAEQTAPVRRHVALKVVKLGMDTREVVARFQAERQALAQMNHPNIAQVFDAGLTNEGRPYFVMEYVSGRMLNTYCDERRLATSARVQLVATICRAVQHAHDRGFIHRDLKPSNVLVAEHEGALVPKVIDFGIAKATAAASDAGATQAMDLRTRADQVLGTPEYMSPEQLCSGGVDIDTRTDVYSLGVTLYELLCGELPFDSRRLRSVGRNELERILRDELPTQPSKRLSQVGGDIVAARGGERATVQRTVAGELDWITLKALAKQRELRYPSALALAEDLERWLRHEPVLAAPPGRTYRLRKFVRRHRVVVAASVIVLTSLVVGLVVSLQATLAATAAQQREAAALADMRRYFTLARDAVGNLVDVADQQLEEVPQAEAARQRLLHDAMQFYASLRAGAPADFDLRVDRLQAMERIGRLQRAMGQPTVALATLEECATEIAALCGQRPDDGRAAALRVTVLGTLAGLHSGLGQGAAARARLEQAMAAFTVARTLPGGGIVEADAQEGRLLANLAIEHEDDPARAIGLFERAAAAFARATPSAALARARARMSVDHAEALTRANRVAEAATALADAVALLRSVPADASLDARAEEATLQSHLATVLRRLDRRSEARAAQVRSIALYEQLATEHPDVPSYTDHAAGGWHFLSQLDQAEAKDDDALTAVRKAVALRESLRARFPQQHRFAMFCVRSMLHQADIEIQQWQRHGGDRELAERTLARAVAIVDELHAAHPDDLDVLFTYCGVHSARGALLVTRTMYTEAIDEHEAVRDALLDRQRRSPDNAELYYHLATSGNNLLQAWYLLGQPGEALAAGEAALRHGEQGLALDARNVALRELLPQLTGRVATARFANDDIAGGIATLQALCAREDWGADAREQGCLLLSNRLVDLDHHEDRDTWIGKLVDDLRRAIAARGSLDDARRRPPQQTGFSQVRSRLRDLDLRLALGDLLGKLGRVGEQEPLVAEAAVLADSLPELSADRVRNLFAQRIELEVARRDAAATERIADELLARAGEHGGANYLLAALLTKALSFADETAKERLATKAVACLRRAFADGEVPAAAAHHETFRPLRGRSDFDALLPR